MTARRLINAALLAVALTGALALDGCGRRGPPVPMDSDAHPPLPHGTDDFSLKAGARKTPTPFDFLL